MSELTRHKAAKRERIRYPCDQCEYSTTRMSDLKKHKEAMHEGIRYPCDHCEFSATQMSNLQRHKEAKHEGIRYSCDQCEFITAYAAKLKRHKKTKHEKHEDTSKPAGNLEVHQKSLHQCDYAAIDPSDQETYDGDLQTKIEVEEDFVLKTESSDLSEFIDQCNREDVKSEDETLQEDNIYMEIMDPAIRAEFFPQLC